MIVHLAQGWENVRYRLDVAFLVPLYWWVVWHHTG